MIVASMTSAPTAGERLFTIIDAHGSAAHDYPASAALLRGGASSDNLADAVHCLCSLHGRHPGIIAHAAARSADADARAWLDALLDQFTVERGFVARLAVEVGPAPSTPGSASVEAVLLGQRHALDMLAQSERGGCGLGAAIALVADWSAARLILNTATGRIGLEAPEWQRLEEHALKTAADRFAATPALERAMLFGAEQLLLQHRGLWDILEARALARDAA